MHINIDAIGQYFYSLAHYKFDSVFDVILFALDLLPLIFTILIVQGLYFAYDNWIITTGWRDPHSAKDIPEGAKEKKGAYIHIWAIQENDHIAFHWEGKRSLWDRNLRVIVRSNDGPESAQRCDRDFSGGSFEEYAQPGQTIHFKFFIEKARHILSVYTIREAYDVMEFSIRMVPPNEKVEQLKRAVDIRDMEAKLNGSSAELKKQRRINSVIAKRRQVREDIGKFSTANDEIDAFERDYLEKIEQSDCSDEEKEEKRERLRSAIIRLRDSV